MSSRRNQFDDNNPLADASISDIDRLVYGELGGIDKPRMDSALVPASDGTIQVGKVKLTPTGLQINGELTPDEWDNLGGFLKKLDKSTQWFIGDWIVYGCKTWDTKYEDIARKTGYSVKSLYNFAYVAGSVHISLRKETLSFMHHSLVAALKPKQQDQWLNYAAENNISASRMKKELREASGVPEPEKISHIDLFAKRYTSFATKQLELSKTAAPGERIQMAEMLRQLADKIERGNE